MATQTPSSRTTNGSRHPQRPKQSHDPLPPSHDQAYNRRNEDSRREQGTTRAASSDDEGNVLIPKVFDLFMDLPHPGASKESSKKPPRFIEPPEKVANSIVSELYHPIARSRIARFAFPDHDDHKQVINLHTRSSFIDPRRHQGKGSEGYNTRDVYVLGCKAERLSFSILLSDGITKLFGHVLRYLPANEHAIGRADVGRRGARAMVLLTRASGGYRFYTGVLKTVEAVMIHGNVSKDTSDDPTFKAATRYMHLLYRRQSQKISDASRRIGKAIKTVGKSPTSEELDDVYLKVSALEYQAVESTRNLLAQTDCVVYRLPSSLQGGYRMGFSLDDTDSPILPLVRCLGAENTIHLVCALMTECRIILVSEEVARLSSCVRGAAAILAQGQLVWQYHLSPVLPPHLLNILTEPHPFLVGLLDSSMKDIEILRSLKDTLCIHLDRNLFKTFGTNVAIPDIVSKTSSGSEVSILMGDIEQIVKAEKRIWATTVEAKQTVEEKAVSSLPHELQSKNEGREYDIATMFGRVMRGESLRGDDESSTAASSTDGSDIARGKPSSGHVPKNEAKIHFKTKGVGTFDVCENERGEEGIRAAFTFFFLVSHGELGVMVSESRDGYFVLDRKKYVTSKKHQGLDDASPLFQLYRKFSGTKMLEIHLSSRIQEFQQGGSLVQPRHRSLFALCERHLRVKKAHFSVGNIRTVIANTSAHSPIHDHIEKTEVARARALALTSAQPFDGDIQQALSSVMDDCRHCDCVLPQTMAVIWSRLDDRRPSGYKHTLLGLHLLKNLLLHGPLSSISFAMDGADKVRRLVLYKSSKTAENYAEVRSTARFVWGLLVDRQRLFLRRQVIAASRSNLLRTENTSLLDEASLKQTASCGSNFRQLHALVRPIALTGEKIRKVENARRGRFSQLAKNRENVIHPGVEKQSTLSQPGRTLDDTFMTGEQDYSWGTEQHRPKVGERGSIIQNMREAYGTVSNERERESISEKRTYEPRNSGTWQANSGVMNKAAPLNGMSSPSFHLDGSSSSRRTFTSVSTSKGPGVEQTATQNSRSGRQRGTQHGDERSSSFTTLKGAGQELKAGKSVSGHASAQFFQGSLPSQNRSRPIEQPAQKASYRSPSSQEPHFQTVDPERRQQLGQGEVQHASQDRGSIIQVNGSRQPSSSLQARTQPRAVSMASAASYDHQRASTPQRKERNRVSVKRHLSINPIPSHGKHTDG